MFSLLPQNGKKRLVYHLSTGIMKMIFETYMKGEVAQDHAALHAIAELFDVSIDYLPGFSEAEKFTFIFTRSWYSIFSISMVRSTRRKVIWKIYGSIDRG